MRVVRGLGHHLSLETSTCRLRACGCSRHPTGAARGTGSPAYASGGGGRRVAPLACVLRRVEPPAPGLARRRAAPPQKDQPPASMLSSTTASALNAASGCSAREPASAAATGDWAPSPGGTSQLREQPRRHVGTRQVGGRLERRAGAGGDALGGSPAAAASSRPRRVAAEMSSSSRPSRSTRSATTAGPPAARRPSSMSARLSGDRAAGVALAISSSGNGLVVTGVAGLAECGHALRDHLLHRLAGGLQVARGSNFSGCSAEHLADRAGDRQAVVGVDVDLADAVPDAELDLLDRHAPAWASSCRRTVDDVVQLLRHRRRAVHHQVRLGQALVDLLDEVHRQHFAVGLAVNL